MVTLIYIQLKGTSWKIDLDDFVDEFDSSHDNRRIKLHWADDDINSNVDSASNCVRIVWICLGVELVRSTQGWEVSFWGSEENSVWILKWSTLLGTFCKISFTPAVTCYYQVHALNADARLSAALLTLGATGAETSLLLTAYCIDNCIQRHNISAADGVRIKYRLDGSLFNIRRLQAVTKVTNDTIFNLQYADDAALLSYTLDGLQRQLHAISSAYSALHWPLTPKRRKSFASPQIRCRTQLFTSAGINLASLNSSRTWEISLPPHVISLRRLNIVLT